MERGIKKFQKHVEKIEKANKTIIDKAVKRVLKLKNRNLSTVKSANSHVFEILVHKDTNNFPILKQKLLAYFNDLHNQYPFISIGYDTIQTNGDNRTLKADNGNRILLTINWNDYMQHAFKESGQDIGQSFLNLGMEKEFDNMKIKNLQTIQYALKDILSKVREHTTKDYTDYQIHLVNNSMSYEITRNHFINIARQLNKQYNGVIEIFHIGMSDDVVLRVHWNIYIAQLAAREKVNKPVELELPDQPIIYTPFPNDCHQEKLSDLKEYPPLSAPNPMPEKVPDYPSLDDLPDLPSEIENKKEKARKKVKKKKAVLN